MRRQRGQSAVEFALMAPIVFLMIFAAIYGGAMFMDYLNFSNEARTVARQIAVSSNKTGVIADYNSSEGGKKFAGFYNVTMTAQAYDTNDEAVSDIDDSTAEYVEITVNFIRDNGDLPLIVYLTGFPPEKINPIKYKMKLEKSGS